jgi:hypothetical protein
LKIDYHMHHVRCGHALRSLRDMIEAAIQRGINQLGLSDHSPLYYLEEDHPIPNMAMAQREFPYYVAEMIRLREEYKIKSMCVWELNRIMYPAGRMYTVQYTVIFLLGLHYRVRSSCRRIPYFQPRAMERSEYRRRQRIFRIWMPRMLKIYTIK